MSQDDIRGEEDPANAPGEADGGEGQTTGGALDDGTAPSGAFYEAAGEVVEDVYELRLTALLRRLVRSRGYKGAGRVLDLDPRTVAASVREGMSRRVRDAVEKMLVERDGGARDELEEVVGGLVEQVGGLQSQVLGLEEELREGMKALGQTHAQGMRRLESRLAQAESRRQECWQAGTPVQSLSRPGVAASSHRRYPQLVTREPAAEDPGVFGGAWPLVEEWRRLWRGHPAQGKGLAWVATRTRILEIEVALLEEHGLTLPPETEPLRGLDRGAQLNWRREALREFWRRRARLELLARLCRPFTPWQWWR